MFPSLFCKVLLCILISGITVVFGPFCVIFQAGFLLVNAGSAGEPCPALIIFLCSIESLKQQLHLKIRTAGLGLHHSECSQTPASQAVTPLSQVSLASWGGFTLTCD